MFEAKYDGQCKGCDFPINKGDYCHYSNDSVCHVGCEVDQEPERIYESVATRQRDGNVRGRRDHEKPCGTCGLTHAGECL
jgi:hypothetical protein